MDIEKDEEISPSDIRVNIKAEVKDELIERLKETFKSLYEKPEFSSRTDFGLPSFSESEIDGLYSDLDKKNFLSDKVNVLKSKYKAKLGDSVAGGTSFFPLESISEKAAEKLISRNPYLPDDDDVKALYYVLADFVVNGKDLSAPNQKHLTKEIETLVLRIREDVRRQIEAQAKEENEEFLSEAMEI